jgi:nitrogen regulatory protein PII
MGLVSRRITPLSRYIYEDFIERPCVKKIEAIIRPVRMEAVKTALAESGVTGITASDVRGCGRQGGQRPSLFRGEEYVIHLPPKIKLEIVVPDDDVDDVIAVILEQAHTGEEGDGKIFVMEATGAVRIRTGESGESVL